MAPLTYHSAHIERLSGAALEELEKSYRGYTSTHIWAKRTLTVTKPGDGAGLTLEAWSQGYMVGSLIIMAAITIANMRKGVLLHKLILLELFLGMFHGTFIFTNPPAYGWYLSCTAILLNASWSLHNVISWMKTKSFLSKRASAIYIGTVILAQSVHQPYWVLEIYANFTYFNNINNIFTYTRPYEAIFRDPWWIASTVILFYQIIHTYNLSILTVIRVSPRFGVLLCAMLLSIAFIILDIVSVTNVLKNALPDGLNPFWKLAFVYKCLVDSIVLDDFKTALERLMVYKMQRERGAENTFDATLGSGSYDGKDLEAMDTNETRPFSAAKDPLGEDVMEQQRADEPRASGQMTFQQMLRTENGESPASQTQAMQHWESLELPEFKTGYS